MHVVVFADQHTDSVGGAQVSVRLQKKYLERAGHTVTVVAPRQYTRSARSRWSQAADRGYLDVPALPVPTDPEYSMLWPGRRADASIDRELMRRVARGLPAPDLVHVQADFWGAFVGHRFALRLRLPVVHTMHNRLDVGIEATSPAPGLTLRALNVWRRRMMPSSGAGMDGWSYLRGIARGAAAVTAPSTHFAARLEQHGVFEPVDVVWNGIDDDVRERVLAAQARPEQRARPQLIWVGRMSPEKRVLPLLESFARARVDADLAIVGGGFEFAAAERLVARHGLGDRVRLLGRLPYEQTLEHLAAADALVQTSIGFETQGMTPFEAATLGTPSIISDPDIAGELGEGIWRVRDEATESGRIEALAQALQRATKDVRSGGAPRPDERVAVEFRQSSRTAAMLRVYRRVVGADDASIST